MVTVKRKVNNDTKGIMHTEQSGYAAAVMNSLNLSYRVSVSFPVDMTGNLQPSPQLLDSQ